ncbi:VC0807 family protein [Streptomyces sp. SUK 48]|uniref:VC0807 family protein n=1 Tax=Streptomyces sp. SUK 48 TaxID=2582831 RepID=UPI00129A93D3|nr:VC0807 family protein [Streptomyces sp. SUK 48]
MTMNTGNHSRNAQQNPSMLDNLRPLVLDVVVPIGAYYVLKDALGASTVAALAWSSVVPAARTVWSLVRERRANALACLILVVNLVSLLVSTLAGDPRLMLAKDGAVSSTVGIGILLSVRLGRPMMTAAVMPFLVKGDAVKEAAWQRLTGGASVRSAAFRQRERTFSLVWGVALLAECVARVVGAYTVPVDTMVWLGTVVLIATMVVAFRISGVLAAGPMERLLEAEVAAGTDSAEAEGNSPLAMSTHK